MARVLAEADSLESAGPALLAAIAEPMGWDVGHLWEVRGNSALRVTATWMRPGFDAPEFEQATRQLVMGRGFGLPGAVWESGLPAWFTNVLDSDKFTRADAARTVGLRGALAFPIRASGECVAVIELFAREEREPDPDLLVLTDALGSLIGEFVEGVASAEAVRQSDARKTAVFASSLDAIITIDHAGNVVEFNRAAERMFGRTAEDAVGSELAELIIPPGLRAAHRTALRRFVATGEGKLLGKHVELTGMRADGSEFPVELAINLIAGAEPPMFTGTVRDITHRRQADEERAEWLRLEQVARLDATQARDQLRAILSGVADAVTAQAPDGRLLFANQAALDLLGLRVDRGAPGRARRPDARPLRDPRRAGRPAAHRAPARTPGAGGRGRRRGGRALPPARHRRGALVRREGHADPRRGRLRDDGDQRHRGHHDPQAGGARAALPGDSSALLASSLEPAELLGQVATLAVPEVADWVAVAHRRRHWHRARGPRARGSGAPPARRGAGRRCPPATTPPGRLRTSCGPASSELYPDIPDELVPRDRRRGARRPASCALSGCARRWSCR